jgi:hypothetical protein
MLDEGGLQGMEFATGCESFDRRDFGAVARDRQNEAGVHASTIDQDRAGATLSLVATLLCAGKFKPLAQEIEERDPRGQR